MVFYPKAEEIMKGSVTALKKKISKIGPVAADDRDELLNLVRIMTAKVLKLKKIQPPIHTNRELVELFLGRLDTDFAARVANKLSVHRLLNAQNQVKDIEARNTEDMYDICRRRDARYGKTYFFRTCKPLWKILGCSPRYSF